MENRNKSSAFVEPEHGAAAGTMVVDRPETPYQRYMASQSVPIYEAPGFRDVRDLDLGDWGARGCKGAFLVPDGTVDLLGMQVLAIPARSSITPQKHLYEEKYFVLEGSGATELRQDGRDGRSIFEWGPGSLFAVPINTTCRIVNTSAKAVWLIVGNTAPPIINTFDDLDFVFNNDYHFRRRFAGEEREFAPDLSVKATPELGRASWETNVVPDVVNTVLPVDNQRSPGYRRIEPRMAKGNFDCFIGEHAPGRYSKAHAHPSMAALVCIRGEGYTYNWPTQCGITPWQDGYGEQVERVDYVQGGLVSAAPGGGDWYHQHFPTGREGVRFLVFLGGLPQMQYSPYIGRGSKQWMNVDVQQGGNSIGYPAEDPRVRQDYEAALIRNNVDFDMDMSLYQ